MADYSLAETKNVQSHRGLTLQPTLITLAAGKTLQMRTTPNGDILLDETVPEGKVWKVTFKFSVFEEDA